MTTGPRLLADIAAIIEMPQLEVREILNGLSAEHIVLLRGGPAANIAAGEQPRQIAHIWYERGEIWKD